MARINNSRKTAARNTASTFEVLEGRQMYSGTPVQVMGYVQDWKTQPNAASSQPMFAEDGTGKVVNDKLNWAALTQVNYFSLRPGTDGVLPTNAAGHVVTASGYDADVQLKGLMNEVAAKHAKTQVFVTVGGGDPTSIAALNGLMNRPDSFATFAAQMKKFVGDYHLAGVDMDWEPTAATQSQVHNYGTLISTLKGQGLTVTAAVLGDAIAIAGQADNLQLNAEAVSNLERINVMAYPATSKAEADGYMQTWARFLAGGKDVDGHTVSGAVGKLQYGMDDDTDDQSNTPAVATAKVDTAVSAGYGGLFLWDLQADANGALTNAVAAEVSAKSTVVTTPATGTITGTARTAAGTGVANVSVFLDANNNGQRDASEQATTTGSDGTYRFGNVPIGQTIVRQQLSTGTTQTAPTNNLGLHVTVTAGTTVGNQNFTDAVATPTPVATPVKLNGQVISANTVNNPSVPWAFDGDSSTSYVGPTASNNWIGLDLGNVLSINSIKFAPNTENPWDMIGGQFEVATKADFSDAKTVYSISSTPAAGLTTVTVNATARYVRYVAPKNAQGTIAEFQVFGH